jgi:hypothetical protein
VGRLADATALFFDASILTKTARRRRETIRRL